MLRNHAQGGWPHGEMRCWPDLSRRTTRRSRSSGRTRVHRVAGLPGEAGAGRADAGAGAAAGAGGDRAAGGAAGAGASAGAERAAGVQRPGAGGRRRRWSRHGAPLGLVPRGVRGGPAGRRARGGGVALPAGAGGAARRTCRRWVRRSGSWPRRCGRRRRCCRGWTWPGRGRSREAALEAYRARAERGREVLAPGYPPRAVRVLELAQRVRAAGASRGRRTRRARRGGERLGDRGAGGGAAAGGADGTAGAGRGVQRVRGGAGAARGAGPGGALPGPGARAVDGAAALASVTAGVVRPVERPGTGYRRCHVNERWRACAESAAWRDALPERRVRTVSRAVPWPSGVPSRRDGVTGA